MINWNSPGGRLIARSTKPKPNWNHDEFNFIKAIFDILPRDKRNKYRYPGVSETSTGPADPWRQLRIGTRVIRAEMSWEWSHAGRIYRLRVTKELSERNDWSWDVRVTNTRWPSGKPVAKGDTLESLHAWAGEKWPDAKLPEILPTDEPMPIKWAEVRYREKRALGLV